MDPTECPGRRGSRMDTDRKILWQIRSHQWLRSGVPLVTHCDKEMRHLIGYPGHVIVEFTGLKSIVDRLGVRQHRWQQAFDAQLSQSPRRSDFDFTPLMPQ